MPPSRRLKIAAAAALIVLAVLAGALVYINARATRLISDEASKYTGLDVDVAIVDVGLSSGITLYGVSVDNPPGFESPELAKLTSVGVRPNYRALLRGELAVDSIRITGPKITIEKDAAGSWNAKKAAELFIERKKKRKPSGKTFSVGEIKVSGGRITAPAQELAVRISRVELTGFSTATDSRTAFSLEADDTKGVKLSASGSAVIFSASPQAEATVVLNAGGLDEYAGGNIAEVVKDAELAATVNIAYRDQAVKADTSSSLTGLRPFKDKKARLVDVYLDTEISYDRVADRLEIGNSSVKLPDIVEVGFSGNISSVTKKPVGDISVILPVTDLVVLKPYLPKDVSVSGVVKPETIRLAGPIRPFGMNADGGLVLDKIMISYRKYAVGPIVGRAGFTAAQEDGAPVAELKAGLAMLGGEVAAGAEYRGGGIKFGVRADGIDTGLIKGLPEQAGTTLGVTLKGDYSGGRLRADTGVEILHGRVDANIDYAKGAGRLTLNLNDIDLSGVRGMKEEMAGRLGGKIEARMSGGRKGTTATYDLAVNGFGLPGRKASAGRVVLKGDAASTPGKGATALGVMSIDEFEGYGRQGGGLTASYSYGRDGISVSDVAYTEESLVARAGRLDAVMRRDGLDMAADGVVVDYKDGLVRTEGGEARLAVDRDGKGALSGARFKLELGKTEVCGLPVTGAICRADYDGRSASSKIGLSASGNPLSIEAKAEIDTGSLKKHSLSGNLDVKDLASLRPAFERLGISVAPSAGSLSVDFTAGGEGREIKTGTGHVKLSGVSVEGRGRTLATAMGAQLAPRFDDGRLTVPQAAIDFGGYFGATIAATAARTDDGWSADADLTVPKTKLASVQEGVLESLPERLMWADVDGVVSAGLHVKYSKTEGGRLTGAVELDGATLGLPDMGLTVGPVFGRIPLGLTFAGAKAAEPPPVLRGETFDRERYPALMKSYSEVPDDADLVIDRIRYGFVELEAVTLDLVPGDGWYDINWFGLSVLDGNLYGYGRADLAGGRHVISLIMSDFSLTALCDTAPPIKGYLAGRVDGLMRLVLSGSDYKGVTGAAAFWAEDGPDEEREISKEFIKKLMGSSMKKYMSLFIGDRYFDTGELEIVFTKGDLVFEKLLIANTNFLGQHDLNITVAPVSNRITIEHLLEVIRDVGARAKGMQ